MCSVQFVHVEVFVVALCVSVVWFGVIVVVVFSDFVCPCLHFFCLCVKQNTFSSASVVVRLFVSMMH